MANRICTRPKRTSAWSSGSSTMADQRGWDGRDPERRRQLEEERDFLMQSLDDLELEHESGGVDEESYAELHDDYTARAAAVIRTLRDGIDVTPTRPAPPRTQARRRVVV